MKTAFVWLFLLLHATEQREYITLRRALLHSGRACKDPKVRHLYTGDPCSCEASCAQNGDCCQDSEYFVPEQQRWGASVASCKEFYDRSAFYLIASCPPDWEQNSIRTKCENPDSKLPDPILGVTVTSRRTNASYVNAHCAICHQDFDAKEDVFWPVRFYCGNWRRIFPQIKVFIIKDDFYYDISTVSKEYFSKINNFTIMTVNSVTNATRRDKSNIIHDSFNLTSESLLPRLKYDENSSAWLLNLTDVVFHEVHLGDGGVAKEIKAHKCKKRGCERNYYNKTLWRCDPVEYPTQLDENILKKCNPNVIGTCSKTWMDEVARNICESYTELWHHGRFVYRNPFCAYCRFVDIESYLKEPANYSYFTNAFRVHLDWTDVNDECSATQVHDPIRGICRDIKKELEVMKEKLSAHNWIPMAIKSHGSVLSYVTVAGLVLSLTSLVLQLLSSVFTLRRPDLSTMNLMSLCTSLFLLHCASIASMFLEPPCVAPAVTTHYGLLVTFLWMLAISCDIWRSIRDNIHKRPVEKGAQWKRFGVYSALCWLLPLVIITVTLIVDFTVGDSNFRPGYGVINCWFQNKEALLVFVVAPLGVIMIANIVLCLSVCLISSTLSSKISMSAEKAFFHLELVMVVTWTVGLIAAVCDVEGLWFVFVILNTLQCVFIFVRFSCNNNETLKRLKNYKTRSSQKDGNHMETSQM